MAVERVAESLQFNHGDRFFVLYGMGVTDTFLTQDYVAYDLESALWQLLRDVKSGVKVALPQFMWSQPERLVDGCLSVWCLGELVPVSQVLGTQGPSGGRKNRTQTSRSTFRFHRHQSTVLRFDKPNLRLATATKSHERPPFKSRVCPCHKGHGR